LLGLVPDTISYVGIALLAGVILYFVREPFIAVLFLAGHLLCDGLDGAYARHAGKASQSGAFTDLVCDQLGMVVVATTAIFHHLVPPLLGTAYITLYLIVVVFGVLINVMGLGIRITITSKYFVYGVYAVWALSGINLFSAVMTFFSAVMCVEVVVSYLRLKRGIRRKFDSEERFAEGDPYSGLLNYVLNVAVPVTVLLAILVGANVVPIRAMLDRPKLSVAWTEGPRLVGESETAGLLGLGVRDKDFLLLIRREDGMEELRRFSPGQDTAAEIFAVPEYVVPAFNALPVDDKVLLIADTSTRLLMGIDLDASFAQKRAVTAFTLPLGYLRVTAMTTAVWNGRKVWLAGNYLYTRKTYVIDPEKALKEGNILGGVVASYANGAFPSGMTFVDDMIVEFNKSPLNALVYMASLRRLIRGTGLLDAARISFFPAQPDAIGPVADGEYLVMLSREGRIYRLPVESLLKQIGKKPA
jgi:phosphatidylglycerophosphate synthase